jgi:predicted SpoU family rRNA methylase
MVETRSSLARTARAANNKTGGVQPHQAMVGMGTLEKLPPEIRNRIYQMVLVEVDRVTLQCYQSKARSEDTER